MGQWLERGGRMAKQMALFARWLCILSVLRMGAGAPEIDDDAGSALVLVQDIEKRVVHAGGKTEGVIVASLSWSTPDDLDLHVRTPTGREINYHNRKVDSGELDVDMCVHGRHSGVCKERPVENVVFVDEAPEGRYEVYIQNFGYHDNVRSKELQVSDVLEGRKDRRNKHKELLKMKRDRPVLFDLVVKVEGEPKLFSGLCTLPGKTHQASNIRVFVFDYFPNAKTPSERVAVHFEASKDPICTAFKRKLLELGGPSHNEPRLEGPRSKNGKAATVRQGQDGPAASHKAKGTGKAKQTKKKGKQGAQETKRKAIDIVRSNTYDTLLGKPAKVLRELLHDAGADCRGCLDKAEFVEKLLRVAGVGEEL
eukprot:TRINITY_DN897_c0_g4_i1.p1 TRINITY_DN897_c0_g4~~TRINITY_DN897_c0_g4_i1.p1  ORF type:complete len:367 (+),score=75.05 TRINITY_DN897_c0_g4_i1:199-1299(+)